jgi:hypothetical protein
MKETSFGILFMAFLIKEITNCNLPPDKINA